MQALFSAIKELILNDYKVFVRIGLFLVETKNVYEYITLHSFYLNKKCRYGRAGKEGKYLHPKLCYSYLNKGSEGCNKDDCQYYHPKICKFQENCKNLQKCKFYHKKPKSKNDKTDNTDKANKTAIPSIKNKQDKPIPKDQNFQPTQPPQDTSQSEILMALKELTRQIQEDRTARNQGPRRPCCSQF